jgi:formate dehydrogenase maturation protein FdhE
MNLSDIERSKNTPPDYHQEEPTQTLECPECGNIWREEMTCTWEENGARWAECGRCYHDFEIEEE